LREIEDALQIAERSGDHLAVAVTRTTLGTALVHRQTAAERDRGEKLLAEVSDVFLRRDTVRSRYRSSTLVGTAADYLRFCTMLLTRGRLDGVRVLGRKTVDYMTTNHLPTGGDLVTMGRPVFSETSCEGIGFGLGFSVMVDPARAHVMGSPGEYAWGGAASTMFWTGPAEDLIGMLLTQPVPSSTYPARRQMRLLTYQAVTE
jgi:CubicO group peptidase (beta-lactamase class C family)